MPTPVEIGSVVERTFRVVWSDGHRAEYTWRTLRMRCPCAACAGEWRHRPPPLTEADVPADIRAMSVSKVGNYALRFVWSDGHDTGLYTYAKLRYELCECGDCRAGRSHGLSPTR